MSLEMRRSEHDSFLNCRLARTEIRYHSTPYPPVDSGETSPFSLWEYECVAHAHYLGKWRAGYEIRIVLHLSNSHAVNPDGDRRVHESHERKWLSRLQNNAYKVATRFEGARHFRPPRAIEAVERIRATKFQGNTTDVRDCHSQCVTGWKRLHHRADDH